MKKNKRLIIALTILIISAVIIFFAKSTVIFFPSQEVESKGELEFGALTKDFLIIQEIPVTKEYLMAVELLLYSPDVQYWNENTLMLLDSNYRTLYTQRFTNENLNRPKYRVFEFPEKIRVGKGQKVILCLFSSTGDKNNHLSVTRNPMGKLGTLSVRPIVNDDVIGTLKDAGKIFLLEGSLCMRTYESNYGFLNWFKIFLFFLASFLALLILFAEKFQSFVVRLTFVPEKIYIVLALVFGLLLVFITPPLQVPDEHDHLNRSYQLAELNIFQYESTVPASLIQMFNTFGGMNFNAFKKASIDEILSQRKVELNPQVRSAVFARPFIFPYIPQALGIFIGKTFNGSPVMLLYMGRIFNLLFSIVLIFLAIRTAPFFKWIFFLLGLMPMTLYLCASLSKDGLAISLAFLLIALFLQFAYDQQKKISKMDLVILFIVSFLVATTRSIYIILIGMFLLIPVYRIGLLKKYVLVLSCLIITVFLATQIGALKPLFQPKAAAATQPTMHLTLSSNALSTPAPTPIPVENFQRSDRPKFPPEGVNFIEQKRFILNNPIQYMGIIFNTVSYSSTFYLDSFVGILGWLNKPLPKWHINLYLWILLITALLFSNKNIRITLTNKLIIASIFTAGVLLIETGLYLVWTPVGGNYILDVQGRYFIPYAPLFFLLLYNTSLEKYLNTIFAPRKKKQGKIKQKDLIKTAAIVQNNQQITLYNSCYLLIVCFSVLSLLSTVYVVLTGYYIILM
ncbi:MAG: hypothetical protein A2031_00025 [Deltaproteobacteria bacterium RBG_19FT_COMBO_43_11]|nr:MAG: hypothetical protein A2W27_09810 [Deltaproteobacteria bacterium RBG_16_44_11]OGP90399.1 MAG: hypothetical protein A2031_00025 [Deltaproteobacteria bacterium RBG_19FT_COMBO_43_11]